MSAKTGGAADWCVATGRKADITSAMASPRSHQDLRALRLPRSLPLLRLLWRCCVPHRMLVRKVVAGPLRTRVGARPSASSASATAVQCWLLTATNLHSTSSPKSSRPDADGPWQLGPDSCLRRQRLVVTSPSLRDKHKRKEPPGKRRLRPRRVESIEKKKSQHCRRHRSPRGRWCIANNSAAAACLDDKRFTLRNSCLCIA